MLRLKKLHERKAALLRDCRAISDKAAADGRDSLNADEQKAYDANMAELGVPAKDGKAPTGLFAEIEREERLADLERSSTSVVPGVGGTGGAVVDPVEQLRSRIVITGLRTRSKFYRDDRDAYLAGRFFLALNGDASSRTWCESLGVQFLSAPGTSDNTRGAILVPTVVAQTIIDLKNQYGVFRANAQPWPMTGESVIVPRRLSGVTLSYPAQNQEAEESDGPGFDGVTLVSKELVGLMAYPKSLADNAVIDFGDYVTREMAYAFAKEEDEAGFTSTGGSTHGGIIGLVTKINDGNHAGGIYTAAAGHTGFETLDMADFTGLVAKLPAYAIKGGNCRWYISSAGFAAAMQRLMYAAGGNTTVTIAGKTMDTFLGYPVERTEALNSTLGADASKVKCLLGDLSLASTIGDRRAYSIEINPHVLFKKRQLCVLGVQWYDIVNHDLGDATSAGPIVALKTPGA